MWNLTVTLLFFGDGTGVDVAMRSCWPDAFSHVAVSAGGWGGMIVSFLRSPVGVPLDSVSFVASVEEADVPGGLMPLMRSEVLVPVPWVGGGLIVAALR